MSAAGTWNATISTPIGAQHAEVTLTQDDAGAWSGTSLARESGEESPLNDLAVNGNEVSWAQQVTRPVQLNVKVTVTIDGDRFTGKAKAGVFPAMNITGERAS